MMTPLTPPQYARALVNEYKQWFGLTHDESKDSALLEMDMSIEDNEDNPVLICYFKQVQKEITKL